MSRLVRGLVALLLASLATCGGDGTSLFLRVEGADGATQLEVRGLRDGEPWFAPQRRPEQEGAPFSGEQSLRLRFNAPPDVPFLLEVDALAGGVPIARGSAEARPRKDEEVELRLRLEPVSVEPLPDGGTPDGGQPDGGAQDDGGTDGGTDGGEPDAGEPDAGEPDAGVPDAGTPDAGGEACGPSNCAGCCPSNGGACVTIRSLGACAIGGLECRVCDETRADTCSASGACVCGTGPSCGEGEVCRGGTCACDPDTCDGCCTSQGCRSGNAVNACGLGGVNCTDCTQLKANNCSAGGCRCGNSAPCTGLTRCNTNNNPATCTL